MLCAGGIHGTRGAHVYREPFTFASVTSINDTDERVGLKHSFLSLSPFSLPKVAYKFACRRTDVTWRYLPRVPFSFALSVSSFLLSTVLSVVSFSRTINTRTRLAGTFLVQLLHMLVSSSLSSCYLLSSSTIAPLLFFIPTLFYCSFLFSALIHVPLLPPSSSSCHSPLSHHILFLLLLVSFASC